MTPTADAHARTQVSPQCRCFVKSRDGGSDDDSNYGADGIAETHDNGKGDEDDDIACQFVIVRVAGVARI